MTYIAIVATPETTSAALSGSGLSGGFGTRGTVTVPRTGYFLIYALCTLSTGDHMTLRIVEGASTVRVSQGNIGGTVGGGQRAVYYGPVLVSSGVQFKAETDHTNGFDTINSGASSINATFIPTKDYPK